MHDVLVIAPRSESALSDAALAKAFEGWHVARADALSCSTDAVVASAADLILVDRAWSLISAIRALDHPIARVPIVAVAPPVIDGADDHLSVVSDDAVAALARRWAPQTLPALDRLASALGETEVLRLAAGLREQLEQALRSLETGGDAALAHRVAGFAGMLGLTELGRDWNALSHGRRDHVASLRIDTRRAIAALDRAVGGSPMPLV